MVFFPSCYCFQQYQLFFRGHIDYQLLFADEIMPLDHMILAEFDSESKDLSDKEIKPLIPSGEHHRLSLMLFSPFIIDPYQRVLPIAELFYCGNEHFSIEFILEYQI